MKPFIVCENLVKIYKVADLEVVALQGLDVTFGIDRAGLVGQDGPTHHGAFDLSYLSCIPNLVSKGFMALTILVRPGIHLSFQSTGSCGSSRPVGWTAPPPR